MRVDVIRNTANLLTCGIEPVIDIGGVRRSDFSLKYSYFISSGAKLFLTFFCSFFFFDQGAGRLKVLIKEQIQNEQSLLYRYFYAKDVYHTSV